MQVQIKQVQFAENAELLTGIREQVFVIEQGVPRDIEMDGQEQEALHFLALGLSETGKYETVLGSARLLPSGQIGRMAVLAEYRGKGIGFKLLEYVTEHAFKQGFTQLFLHAQKHAYHFYEKAGFISKGEDFLEAGIAHVEMQKSATKL